MTIGEMPSIPAHVPSALVWNVDPWEEIARAGEDAYARAARLHAELPPVVWVPRMGVLPGCWMPRRASDLRLILQDPATFSSVGLTPFARMLGEKWSLIPLEIDPPDHRKYRALLNPLFSPPRVEALDSDVRKMATELIEAFASRGHCDFNTEFANRFPALIFLRLMGWPTEAAPLFVSWTQTLIKSQDIAVIVGAAREIAAYLRDRIAERRADPGEDFTSYVLAADIDGRKLTEDEVFGICFLVFIGGLDTVGSSLGFHYLHLARHPEHQAQLRSRPELVPNAVDELLRAYSVVNGRRTVTRDVEIGGAPMRAGDFVMISSELANLDPEAFENPTRVDFERKGAHKHMAFSYGVHHCVGMHLARRELRIALETWLQLVPQFHVSSHKSPTVRISGVFGIDDLHLQWDVPASA